MSKELRSLEEKKIAGENELKELEKFIYKLETNYLRDSTVEGNIIKGWEGLVNQKSSKNNAYPSKKQNGRTIVEKERIFSLSSSTLPCRISEYETSEVPLPSKRKVLTTSKTSKRPAKRKNSDTDDYSEEVA
jgi:Histone acetyltransferase subunit NuA4